MDATIAMIPARMGSERLPRKNLVLLNGEPLVGHVVRAAQKANVFNRIVINADHPVFGEIAQQYGVEFYQRPPELATSAAQSDDVVYDFMQKHPAAYVAWVNSIAPLQTATEIANVVNYFLGQHLDSLVTVHAEQVHCNFKNQPLNYTLTGKFAKTQDLIPVERFVYSIMMWRTQAFIDFYRQHGYALLFGKTGFYAVDRLSALIVKYEADLRLCEAILKGFAEIQTTPIKYYEDQK
jgi:CMP-N-acetylneuraminic acid synthetase